MRDDSPLEYLNSTAKTADALLVCDHASLDIPASLGTLGLSASDRRKHIAFDIGAAEVTRGLAAALCLPAVLARWSRLVVDCNRSPDDPTAVAAVSDNVRIFGNESLDDAARRRRIDRFHRPYHAAIEQALDGMCESGASPALIAIHSFTPILDGHVRPWQAGVLWDRDVRLAAPLLRMLRDLGYCVGDNQPYSGRHPTNYTVDRHGARRGLRHVGIEIRQDLIDSSAGVDCWVRVLTGALRSTLRGPGTAR